jgi:hypothetical protein
VQGEPLGVRNRPDYPLQWFAPDGKSLFGLTSRAQLDVWDLESRRKGQSRHLKASTNITPAWPAPQAGLVVLHEGQDRNVDVFDAASGKLVTVLQLPFRKGRVRAISGDARRLVVSTDQLSLLVLDFPAGLPAGTIDLGQVLAKAKLPATR